MAETTPFPAAGAAPQPPPAVVDPLAGDWSEGLRGPVRALGIVEPKLLALEGLASPAPLLPRPAAPGPQKPAAPAEAVEAPDAWGASDDALSQPPPPPQPEPSVIANITGAFQAPSFQPDVTPPSPVPSFLPDVTPPSPAPAFSEPPPAAVAPPAETTPAAEFKAEITPAMAMPAPHVPEPSPESAPPPALQTPGADAEVWGAAAAAAPAPTPWSEQTDPGAQVAWDAPPPAPAPMSVASEVADGGQVVATEDVVWSAPPPAAESEHVSEWKPEAPPSDWEEVKKPAAPIAQAAADWSTLNSGPDWNAAAAAAPASGDESWGAPPPAPQADAWSAAPSEPAAADEWSAPPAPAAAAAEWEAPAPAAAAAEASDWMAPPASVPPAAAKPWGGPPAGASTFEQMEAEAEAPQPAAAQDLFGSVPAGGSLAGDDEPPHELHEELQPEELPPEELGPPEELASPEDFLKPVEDDDPDLLVPVDEDEPPPPPRATTLAAMQTVNPLEVRGEHRVAVHMRRGGTKRGSVKDVDLSKPQFPLLPQGGGAPESVYHADVKAVFFMLAPGEKVRPGDGKKVRVTFSDGRSIEGVRDGVDARPGFFIVPVDAQRTNTRRIYVAREATSEIKDS